MREKTVESVAENRRFEATAVCGEVCAVERSETATASGERSDP